MAVMAFIPSIMIFLLFYFFVVEHACWQLATNFISGASYRIKCYQVEKRFK